MTNWRQLDGARTDWRGEFTLYGNGGHVAGGKKQARYWRQTAGAGSRAGPRRAGKQDKRAACAATLPGPGSQRHEAGAVDATALQELSDEVVVEFALLPTRAHSAAPH